MDTAQLQLVFNVVALTGVTSLASFCYLLKQENRKLAGHGAKSQPEQQRDTVAAVRVPSPEKDIRAYTAGMRATWVDGIRLTAPVPHVGTAVPKA